MALPDVFIDALVSKNDILDVVSGYVHLMKKSGSNMFGLCPFHREKTPSFSVNADKQIYHCFGCGKGGGVINFIMEIENLSFPDAVAVLAKRAGMTVPDDRVSKETHSRRARLLELNKDAARFFYSQLLSDRGEAARRYIAGRDIAPAMVRRFGIGAAPDSWDALHRAMAEKGYTNRELLDAGLVRAGKRDVGHVYDTFRDRLMFPVIDVRGSVIGFSGRALGDGEPKYLNSPDTPVFDKSRNLFALNLAKKTKMGMLILAEGNIDVVALHQAGFDGAVASLGTSLTQEQARLMARYAPQAVIAYDSDEAGIRAAGRAIGLLEKEGLNVRVLHMDGAKDPDEYVRKFGADAFSLLLERSENHIDYRLSAIRQKHPLDTDDGRLAFLAEAMELLSKLGSAVEREIYGAKVAEASGVSAEAVQNEVSKAFKRRMKAERKKKERAVQNVSAGFQPADRAIRYESVYSAAAEEGVLRLLTLDNSLFDIAEARQLGEEEFTSPFLKKVYGLMLRRRGAGLEASPAAILAELEKPEAARFTELLQKPESLASGDRAMGDYIDKIRAEKIKRNAREDPLAELLKYRETTGCGG